jgi:hypothetical protein
MKDRPDYAVIAALVKAGLKRRPKLKPNDRARRLAIETALQQRRYCNAFELWRLCRLKLCRRRRTCCGDQNACLKRALDRVPRDVQRQTRESILKRTPPNIGAPEREARHRMPRDFYE